MNRLFNYISTIFFIVFLCGCGIYGKYKRPDMETANLYGELTEDTDTVSLLSEYEMA